MNMQFYGQSPSFGNSIPMSISMTNPYASIAISTNASTTVTTPLIFNGGAASLIGQYTTPVSPTLYANKVIDQWGIVTEWVDDWGTTDGWITNRVIDPNTFKTKVIRRKRKAQEPRKRPLRKELIEWYCLDCRFLDQAVEPIKPDRDWLAGRSCDNCGKVQRLIITTVKSRLFRFENSPDVVRVPGQNDKPCAKEVKVIILKKEIVDAIRKVA